MLLEKPPVRDCTVSDCAFNSARSCHAGPITIGKGEGVVCNTFLREAGPPARNGGEGRVEACRVYWCLRNRDMECIAYSIKVRPWEGQPQCRSFKNRYKEGTN
jgi:hypothetical protein